MAVCWGMRTVARKSRRCTLPHFAPRARKLLLCNKAMLSTWRPGAIDPHPAKGVIRPGTLATMPFASTATVKAPLLASHRRFSISTTDLAQHVSWLARRPALACEDRNSSRSPSARDGHRFESAQLHQTGWCAVRRIRQEAGPANKPLYAALCAVAGEPRERSSLTTAKLIIKRREEGDGRRVQGARAGLSRGGYFLDRRNASLAVTPQSIVYPKRGAARYEVSLRA